jgi:hypothetical protein
MERCATARCAIRLMGSTAEQFGYYGIRAPIILLFLGCLVLILLLW